MSVAESQIFEQQTSVHKSSGAEIFCGNRPWKHECKINVVTVRKYSYLGFRLSIISGLLQVNMGKFVWTYRSPNLEYIPIGVKCSELTVINMIRILNSNVISDKHHVQRMYY